MASTHLSDTLAFTIQILGAAVLLLAGFRDMWSRKIPNAFVVIMLGLGALYLIMTPSPLLNLGGFLAVFAGTVMCWRMGWLGGGDTKLLAAAALLVPPEMIPVQIAAVTLAGGLLAVAAFFGRWSLADAVRPARHHAWTPLRIARIEMWRIQHGEGLPYAMAIALGTITAVLAYRVAFL
jgi:prepilin peptidase CpaA